MVFDKVRSTCCVVAGAAAISLAAFPISGQRTGDGLAQALTDPAAVTAVAAGSQPADIRFTRDDKRVLTVTRDTRGLPGVFAITLDGRLARLRSLARGASSAALSPDAMKLADYLPSADGGPRVLIESLAGRRVARSAPLRASPYEDPQIVWSPRGDRLLVSQGRRSLVLDAKTGRALGTAPAPTSYLDRQLWDPRGRRVAVPTSRGVLLVNPVTHASRTIGDARDAGSEIAAWSPDGRYVLVRGREGPVLLAVNSSARIPLPLGPSPGHEASWSPDSRTIAYFSVPASRNRVAVTTVAVSPDGTAGRPVVHEISAPDATAGYLLRWSDDGTRLAFYAHDQV